MTIASKEQESGMIQVNESINILGSATQKNASTASLIDGLAKEVTQLSKRLNSITSSTQIDDKYLNRVNDIDLINEITRHKFNHILLKKEFFKNLDEFETFQLFGGTSSKMAKWMVSCENENKNFTKNPI